MDCEEGKRGITNDTGGSDSAVSGYSDSKDERGVDMADTEHHVYKLTTLVGTSGTGYDDALKRAIERAQKTLRNVQWFEVKEQRGRITAAGVEYQVTLDVGFALEESK